MVEQSTLLYLDLPMTKCHPPQESMHRIYLITSNIHPLCSFPTSGHTGVTPLNSMFMPASNQPFTRQFQSCYVNALQIDPFSTQEVQYMK